MPVSGKAPAGRKGTEMKTTHYFAYGANTNLDAMKTRCPGATPVAPALLKGFKLVFRGVADVVSDPKAEVFGALWTITAADEKALDRFEGFPMLYVKRFVRMKLDGKTRSVMMYVMRDRSWEDEPHETYLRTLRHGYGQFGLPLAQLDTAVAHAKAVAIRFRKKVTLYADAKWEQTQMEKLAAFADDRGPAEANDDASVSYWADSITRDYLRTKGKGGGA